jgi:hydrogenase maturation protease
MLDLQPYNLNMRTLIIGLGNPILGDDGIGWAVADELHKIYPSPAGRGDRGEGNQESIEVDTASLGGISLMERLVGYDRVILIDAIKTGQHPVGTVTVFPLEELSNPSAGHSASTHDTTLLTALEMGRQMDAHLPQSVTVVAIEAQIVYDFSEELSPEIAAAVPVAVNKVLGLL